MVAHSADSLRRNRRLLFLFLILVFSTAVFSSVAEKVRYLTFAEATETLKLFTGSAIPGSDISSSAAWDRWIRNQDRDVRSRIDRGVEDSITNLILYGTSYTNLSRFENPESAIDASGSATDPAKARVQALVTALSSSSLNERLRIVRDFLKSKNVAPANMLNFLTENLQRFAAEQLSYQKKLEDAGKSHDMDEIISTRGTLFQARGLSADTSLLPNFALEDTLQALSAKGVLAEGAFHRIAVVGPGLDFTNKHDGYDFYPLQTIQPFAIMETALRLKLAKADDVEIVTMDLNPGVNAHVARLARDARAGHAYTVQLPHDDADAWSPAAIAYWEHFGEILGSPAKPLSIPQTIERVQLRAIAIAPRFAVRVNPLDINIVAQRVDSESGHAFDLIIATNILVYYDRFQQGLALASISDMLNPGGIFLSNDALSAHHTQSLEFLGRRTVSFSTTGRGDNVLVYRRR